MTKHKVVYNNCVGGFGISIAAYNRLAELGGNVNTYDFIRHDENLVQVVEELGSEANGQFAHLAIREIECSEYFIENCDGLERVVAKDDIEWIKIQYC